MTTLDSLLTAPEAAERPKRYKGKRRAYRDPIGNRIAVAIGFVLLVAFAAFGLGLKVGSPGAAVAPGWVVPAPTPWVEPSHPAGTGESLRIRKEETR